MQRCFNAVVCALAFLPLLAGGCGTKTATTAAVTPTIVTATVDGRWSIAPTTSALAGSNLLPPVNGAQFQGAFATNGSQVTGAGEVTFIAEPGSANFACVGPPRTVLLHGTFNTARHLSLVSDPLSDGSVLQVEIDVPVDPHQPSAGTTTFTSPCVTATSTARGLLYEPINGTYSGPVSGLDPDTHKPVTLGTATAVLAETAPDQTGTSVVTGDLTVQFSTCTTHIVVNENRIGSTAGVGGIPGVPLPLPIALVMDSPDGTRINTIFSGLGQNCQTVETVSPAITGGVTATMTRQ